MAFVQIIVFRSSKIDEMRAVADQWEVEAGGSRRAGRVLVCADETIRATTTGPDAARRGP